MTKEQDAILRGLALSIRRLEDELRHLRLISPDPFAAEPRPLLVAVGDFLASRSHCRQATRNHYKWCLTPLAKFVGESLPTSMLVAEDVSGWLMSVSPNLHTRRTYLKAAGIFCRWLVLHGMASRDITREIPIGTRPDKLSSKMISSGDVCRLADSASVSRTPYMLAVIVVAYELALRLGEVCAMKVSWIDVERGTLTSIQDESFQTKSGASFVKPISARALAVLQSQIEGLAPEEHVFSNTKGRRLEPKHTSKTFKQIARSIGLKETATFHGLRHGALSRVAQNGASVEAVRRFAGHSSSVMTMRYLHLNDAGYHRQINEAMSPSSY